MVKSFDSAAVRLMKKTETSYNGVHQLYPIQRACQIAKKLSPVFWTARLESLPSKGAHVFVPSQPIPKK